MHARGPEIDVDVLVGPPAEAWEQITRDDYTRA